MRHIWYNRFMIQLSNEDARHYLLERQLLMRPHAVTGKDAVDTVFKKLRIIQYDPLNPCGRNPDLVLQARISGYHPDGYLRWLYDEKKGIDCYDKELCIIPLEDFPLTQHNRARAQTQRKSFLKRYRTEIEELLLFVEQHGPITSSDVTVKKRVRGDWSDNATFGRMALEILWKVGRLVVVGRTAGRKMYDLPHRAYGHDITGHDRAVEREHVLRRISAVGLLPASASGGGWQGMGGGRMAWAVVKSLIQEGSLTEVAVTDSSRRYVAVTEEMDAFINNNTHEPGRTMVFVAPLDTFMWDRDTIEDLFGFKYRWEVYTPLSKRQYGYYVLPILYGDKLVGRIEPVYQGTTLTIRNVWKESGWPASDEPLERAIETFQAYLRAREVRIERTAPGA